MFKFLKGLFTKEKEIVMYSGKNKRNSKTRWILKGDEIIIQKRA